jgi:twitching motility protein PilT
LEELNLPATLSRIVDFHDGLVLVGGPTGSGKTTTIAALLDGINHRRSAHIITIEDPIEYMYVDDQAVVHQRELGLDVPTMAEALRSIVREDPDVVLLGELRDAETVEMALQASETGHLVFGTVHTPGAAQTVGRLLDLFPASRHAQIRSNLAYNLRVITNQRLVPAVDPKLGRVPAVETMFSTPIVRKLLQEGELNRLGEALSRDVDSGSEDFRRVLLRLHRAGRISAQNALAYAPNPDEMRMALRGINFTEGGIV